MRAVPVDPDIAAGSPPALVRPGWAWGAAAVALVLVLGTIVGLRGYNARVQVWGLPFWQVDYASGFIRRGLVGSVFAVVTGSSGHDIDTRLVERISLSLVALLLAGCAAWIGWTVSAAANRSTALRLMAITLPVIASALFPTLVFNTGYLDALLLVVVLLCAALIAHDRVLAASLIAMVAPLAHELFIVLWLPIAVLGISVAMRRRAGARRQTALVSLCLPLATTLIVVLAASATATHAQIARVSGSAQFRTLLEHNQWGQSTATALRTMETLQEAHWWPNEVAALAFFSWPALFAAVAYALWRRPDLGTWEVLALATSVVVPMAALAFAWDLSRLLVLANATTLMIVLGVETAHRAQPLPQLPPSRMAILCVPTLVAAATPFIYAYFSSSYYFDNGPVHLDAIEIVRPLLERTLGLSP